MTEIELIAEKLTEHDNTINVEMSLEEIWFLKHFIKTFNPKKIVEVGVASGGNTVNILKWKDKDAELFSVDISTYWWKNKSKLTGFMADELDVKDNWRIYRGYDYLDVYEEIGNDIDCIIIDTTHVMPGECLTFLATLPQLKDGCIVILHDIHLNMMRFSRNKFSSLDAAQFCTGLLFGCVSSSRKWILKTDVMSNIGAFIIDKSTRDNIKDLFHVLCTPWHMFPSGLDFFKYKKFIKDNYSLECSNLFNECVKLHANCFDVNINKTAETMRVDILNKNNMDNTIEFLNAPNFVNIDFPDWFKFEEGRGAVLQTTENSFDISLKCINEGVLTVFLKGPVVRNRLGERVPSFVDFVDFKVNNEKILKEHVAVWHDNPYVFERDVKDGEIIKLHFDWTYYASPTIPFE